MSKKKSQVAKNWSNAELWAWEQLKVGGIADFTERYNKELDPKELLGWEDELNDRVLSQNFIETILVQENFHADGKRGVRITGAYFKETIDLEHIRLEHQLWLNDCRFVGSLNLINIQINGWFSLYGSYIHENFDFQGAFCDSMVNMMEIYINGETYLNNSKIVGTILMTGSTFGNMLDMQSIEIGQNLLMGDYAEFQDIDLTNSKISGIIDISTSTFGDKLDMGFIEVGQHLLMGDYAEFQDIDLAGSKISGYIDMRTSTFSDKLDMSSIEVDKDLLMSEKAEFQSTDLNGSKIGGQVDMSTSTFGDKLDMHSIEIGQDLLMGEKAEFRDIHLAGSKISGIIDMSTSTFGDKLDMHSIEIGQDLLMSEKAEFQHIDLTDSKISGSIDMNTSTFSDKLDMSYIEVNEDLFMYEKAEFQSTYLTGSKIGGQIIMKDSKFRDKLDLNSIQVGKDIQMENSSFNLVDLIAATIGRDFEIRNCFYHSEIILQGINIGNRFLTQNTIFSKDPIDIKYSNIGSIDLGRSSIRHLDLSYTNVLTYFFIEFSESEELFDTDNYPYLILHNTTVGTILVSENKYSLPKKLNLQGLTYNRFEDKVPKMHSDDIMKIDVMNVGMRKNKINNYLQWLKLDRQYHPQPYEFLANIQNEEGYPAIADAIRYASRKRTTREAWKTQEFSRWFGLTLLKYTIGYGLGIRYFRVLYWFFALAIIGVLVLVNTKIGSDQDYFKIFWASLDTVIPVITFDRNNEIFVFEKSSNFVKLYFYFQKVCGYALGGFLVAGLSGLTQKT